MLTGSVVNVFLCALEVGFESLPPTSYALTRRFADGTAVPTSYDAPLLGGDAAAALKIGLDIRRILVAGVTRNEGEYPSRSHRQYGLIARCGRSLGTGKTFGCRFPAGGLFRWTFRLSRGWPCSP